MLTLVSGIFIVKQQSTGRHIVPLRPTGRHIVFAAHFRVEVVNTNVIDRHDITEILLKVALNTIAPQM
jgi:hypothetical protein